MAETPIIGQGTYSLREFAYLRETNVDVFTTPEETRALHEAGILSQVADVVEKKYVAGGIILDRSSLRAGLQHRLELYTGENGNVDIITNQEPRLVVVYETIADEVRASGLSQFPVRRVFGELQSSPVRYRLGGMKDSKSSDSIVLSSEQSSVVEGLFQQPRRPALIIPRPSRPRP